MVPYQIDSSIKNVRTHGCYYTSLMYICSEFLKKDFSKEEFDKIFESCSQLKYINNTTKKAYVQNAWGVCDYNKVNLVNFKKYEIADFKKCDPKKYYICGFYSDADESHFMVYRPFEDVSLVFDPLGPGGDRFWKDYKLKIVQEFTFKGV